METRGTKMRKHHHNQPKTLRSRIIDMILILIIIIGIGMTGHYFYQRHAIKQSDQQTTQLANKVVTKNKTKTSMPSEGNIKINWKKLAKTNPNIKAWVYIPGTNINYPVLQAKNNSYYLDHNEHNKPSVTGQIFMDYRNSAKLTSQNTFLYGHDVYDASKFSYLNHYFKADFFKAHRHVYLYTPTKKYVGTIFAVQANRGPSRAQTLTFKNHKNMKSYVKYLKRKSTVKTTNVKTSSVNKILTLWTCTERAVPDDSGKTIPKDKTRTFVSASLKEVK